MDPGTIGLLVAEGSALAAIAAAYSLGREPTKTTTTTAPAPAPAPVEPVGTPAPAPAPVEPVGTPAPAPAPATAIVPAPVTALPPTPPPTQEAVADVPLPPLEDDDIMRTPTRNLDEIIDEVIAIAKTEAAKPPPKSVFQRMREYRPFAKTRDRITEWQTARNKAYEQRMKGGRRKTVRRGGANPLIKLFVPKIKDKLYAISEPTDQKPQVAFARLVSAGNPSDEPEADKVAILLLPILNTFTWWRFNVLSMKLRYSPIMVADAETLYADIKTPDQIQRMFAYNNRTLYRIKYPPTVPAPDAAEAQKQEEAAAVATDSTITGTSGQTTTAADDQEFLGPPPSDSFTTTTTVTEPVVTSQPTPVAEPVVTSESITVSEPVVTPEPTPVAEPVVTPEPTPVVDQVVPQTTPVAEQVVTVEPQRPVSPPNAPSYFESLEIPPELQVKLDAAREKFETLKAKIANEETKPGSPFAKLDSKQKRSEAARRAAVTRQKNKVIAARDAEIQKAALEFRRKDANQARDERARKRAGIVPTIVETTEPSMNEATVESILETTEASTNEIAESLKALEKERPASASQNWFMDIENELQMYFEYYNQVERDLADVPPAQSASIPIIPQPQSASIPVIPPTLPTIPRQQKEALQLKKLTPSKAVNYGPNKTRQRFPVRKGGTPKKHKKTKTRKLTFRRSRKQ